MKKVIFTFILFVVMIKNTYSILIDTDCSADDFRAICLILAANHIHISCITTSDGTLKPKQGAIKIIELLNSINKNTIPVGQGRDLNIQPPIWQKYYTDIKWGNAISNLRAFNEAKTLIIEQLQNSSEPQYVLCLAPLTNLADAIKSNPNMKNKIKKIIWYNDSFNSGFNYSTDTESANYVLSLPIPIAIISNNNDANLQFDLSFLNTIKLLNTPYANHLVEFFYQPSMVKLLNDNHLKLWDDLAAMYLLYPEIFEMKANIKNPNQSFVLNIQTNYVKPLIIDVLAGNYNTEKNIVFKKFPADSIFYKIDVAAFMNSIINKYGNDEWRACVLTNEIHGHLGVYSIVGAKMGIKARELLNAPIDRISVISYAGNKPPYSCLNDGIQVSTGATLGLGMIDIKKDTNFIPAAIFSYNNKSVRIELKQSYRQQIDNDFEEAIIKYGNLTDGYWKLVRQQGLTYWEQWNRNEIFDVLYLK